MRSRDTVSTEDLWLTVPSSIVMQGSNGACIRSEQGIQGQKECLDTWVAKKITIQNLEVVRVDAENNLLLVKGAVPGPKKSLVTIKETVKASYRFN